MFLYPAQPNQSPCYAQPSQSSYPAQLNQSPCPVQPHQSPCPVQPHQSLCPVQPHQSPCPVYPTQRDCYSNRQFYSDNRVYQWASDRRPGRHQVHLKPTPSSGTTNVKRADFIQHGQENHIYQNCKIIYRFPESSKVSSNQVDSTGSNSSSGSGSKSFNTDSVSKRQFHGNATISRGCRGSTEAEDKNISIATHKRKVLEETGSAKRFKADDFQYPNSQSIICITDKVKLFDSEGEMVRKGDILFVDEQNKLYYGIYLGDGQISFTEPTGLICIRHLEQENLRYPVATEQFDSVARLSGLVPKSLGETVKKAKSFIGHRFHGDGEAFVRFCRYNTC